MGIDVPIEPLPPPPSHAHPMQSNGLPATLAAHPGKTGIGLVMALALSFFGGGELMSKADHDAEMARTAEISSIRADMKLQSQATDAKIDSLIKSIDDLKTSVKKSVEKSDDHESRIIRLEGRVLSVENRLSMSRKRDITWKNNYATYCKRNPGICIGDD